jgi:hypothetical protein
MHIPCQTPKRARIGKFAHESGRSAPALERFAPVEAGGVERFAPVEARGVERFAPLGSLPTASRGNNAHESGNRATDNLGWSAFMRRHLLATTRTPGRPQDLADVAILEGLD